MRFNLTNYEHFTGKVDRLSHKLSALHQNQMQCRKGCDLCCMNYRIFPVEYFAIQQALEQKPVESRESVDGGCVFLKDHACQIYENRPLICRTHGLPLLFMNDEQWELSACELNFTGFDDDDFTGENTFPQDTFNSELFMLNKQFTANHGLAFSEFDLLEMKDLHKR